MRTDDNLARRSFRFSDAWQADAATGRVSPGIDARLAGTETTDDGTLVVHSLSGHERNHLFVNDGADGFHDASLVSGIDSKADSRGWAALDYDRDGFTDIAVVNANAPLFQLFHNNAGQLPGTQHNRVVALRFVGGNSTGQPSPGLSNRDGYGALVTAEVGDKTIVREHRCGEGFASQNSATMRLGIGTADKVDHISVRWPSGKFTVAEDVPAGKLLTLREDHEGVSADETYTLGLPAPRPPDTPTTPLPVPDTAAPSASLRLYTTTATWCPSCLAHLPRQQHLRDSLAADQLDLIALPIDPEDTAEKLAAYAAQHTLPYRQLTGLTTNQRTAATAFLTAQLDLPAGTDPPLPCSILTDRHGNVLLTQKGLPTLSQIRELLAE